MRSPRWPVVLAVIVGAGCGRIAFDDGDLASALAVALAPERTTVNLSSVTALGATGGTPPYRFSATDGTVTSTGVFRCPMHAGLVTVEVRDATDEVAGATIDCRGTQLFVLGGRHMDDGIITDEVLASDDGVTWTVRGRLPGVVVYGLAIVFDDYLFYLGGNIEAPTYSDRVWRSPDGVTWEEVGRLPMPSVGFAIAGHRDEIWMIGGDLDGIDTASAYRSPDGQVWTQLADYPIMTHDLFAVSRGPSLYVLGGHYVDLVHRTTDGSTWELLPARLGHAPDSAALGELDGLVMHGSGTAATTTYTTDFVTWSPGPAVPITTIPAMSSFEGRLLLSVEGEIRELTPTSAAIVGALPRPLQGHRMVQFTPVRTN